MFDNIPTLHAYARLDYPNYDIKTGSANISDQCISKTFIGNEMFFVNMFR